MPKPEHGIDSAAFRTPLWKYVQRSRLGVFLSSPLIYLCLIPFVLLDACISLYQGVCFPIYGVPRVQRRHYFVYDRGRLKYLNLLERLNCIYCSYANGVAGYVTEITARTEQHWCPIKHKKDAARHHDRYATFLPYGDAQTYRERIEEVRRNFRNLPG